MMIRPLELPNKTIAMQNLNELIYTKLSHSEFNERLVGLEEDINQLWMNAHNWRTAYFEVKRRILND